ncbi:MAG: hypothetical protein QOH86_341, partial [Sphingomonadales bacterium]|nr:hypothetical protein [Sphingomonadales bacterium]
MKIVVHGAGSIGCFVGGAWAAAGMDVAFVGRQADAPAGEIGEGETVGGDRRTDALAADIGDFEPRRLPGAA